MIPKYLGIVLVLFPECPKLSTNETKVNYIINKINTLAVMELWSYGDNVTAA